MSAVCISVSIFFCYTPYSLCMKHKTVKNTDTLETNVLMYYNFC